MLKGALFIFFALGSIISNGQGDLGQLRLITGFPDNKFVSEIGDYVNVSAILKIESDTLIEESLITDSLQRLDFIRCYPEYNTIIALSKLKKNKYELVPSLNYNLTLIDIITLEKRTALIPNLINKEGKNYTFYPNEFASIIEGKEVQIVLKYVNFEVPESESTTGILYYIFNPMTNGLSQTEPSIYRMAIANSGNLVLVNNYEGEILKGDTLTNELKIATSKFYKNPVYCNYLSNDAKISRKSYAYSAATVLINNDDVLVLYLYERIQRGKWIFSKIRVFDKHEKVWNNFELETSWVLAKYFDKYITGNYRVKQLKNNDPNFPFNEQYWMKEKTKYGPSYKYFFVESPQWRYYSEGDLYLYNIKNKNMIRWNTGHGDSEVILVQDEIVYYRANDKIFRASISKGKAIRKSDLLIQDGRIRDVHWAFISKK